ncbi:polymorphic toxin type 28 domain-containing protein [Lysinibacillus sp. RSDA_15]|uniref:polymorphic toxin type 28 domain-containing protein n=1 Tax=Lysinibacillus TaxID=400634 RepID=UPI001FAF4B44|nr:polymorphic toxin type 28 domain-containing protein [Lysinibacillus sphaericus]
MKTQIQSKVAEVKQQLRQMLQSQQHEFSFAGIKIEDTGTVGRNTPTPSPKPSNTQPSQNGSNKKPAEDKGTVNVTRAQQRNLDTLDNIVNKHLTDKDFSGTLRDLQGNPVPKPGGGYWNHLQEMQDSYKGLVKIRKGLEGSVKNPNLDAETRKVLQDGLDKANKNIKKIEDLFEPFGGI